ncbi:MAG: hypothetical protein P0Y60_03185 [Candidatus Microbacterium colombiense]|nr:MAG: hypothetical protein P0Y60_03185 [Microbacterium sp.]
MTRWATSSRRCPPHCAAATAPALPEMGQMRVLKHYLRLSQENLGADFNVDIGQGTCTMKYAPKINDQLAGTPQLTAMHPHQDPADAQGVLEILWQLERMLAEISGMDEVSLHTQGGSAAIWANIAMIRAFHAARTARRAAARGHHHDLLATPPTRRRRRRPATEVITVFPDADGYPSLDALQAALSPRTAAIMVTNPEDTGIYNPRIREWVDARARGRRARLVRPGQRQRHPRHHPRARRRVRRVPLQPAQDLRHPARLRRTRLGRERRVRGARAVPARPGGRARRRPLRRWIADRAPVDRLRRPVLRRHPEHRADVRVDQRARRRGPARRAPRPRC